MPQRTVGSLLCQLMENAERRLAQEVARLGGDCAHVLGEEITPRHDHAAGEAWLHGRFSFMLYRMPVASTDPAR